MRGSPVRAQANASSVIMTGACFILVAPATMPPFARDPLTVASVSMKQPKGSLAGAPRTGPTESSAARHHTAALEVSTTG